MPTTKSAEERREYFRIKNWIMLNHQKIDDLGDDDGLEALESGSPRINLLQAMSQIEADNQNYLASLSGKQSQLGGYILNMNKKIELLTQFVVQSLDSDSSTLTEVDISGGGIRYTCDEKLEIDQLLKLELVLVPECYGILAYGRVVDCKPATNGKGFDLAIIFVQLKETHRDAIIKHVFQVQSKQLRDVKKDTSA